MSINATLITQILVFGILIWFTMKFVWPIIIGAMEERNQRIADGLAAAEEGQRSLETARDKVDALVAEARTQAAGIIDQANSRAALLVEEARAEAQHEKDRIVARAHAEVEQEINRARDELRAQVGAIAIAGAEKILTREIDARTHQDLLAKLAAEL